MDSEYYREMEYLGAEMNAAEYWREFDAAEAAAEFWREFDALDVDDENEPPPTPDELAHWREQDAIGAQQERDADAGAYDADDADLGRTYVDTDSL